MYTVNITLETLGIDANFVVIPMFAAMFAIVFASVFAAVFAMQH